MARRSKGPWRRKSDKCWYTKVGGKQTKVADADATFSIAEVVPIPRTSTVLKLG